MQNAHLQFHVHVWWASGTSGFGSILCIVLKNLEMKTLHCLVEKVWNVKLKFFVKENGEFERSKSQTLKNQF